MVDQWVQVSRAEASGHPLYGVRGWLLAILLLQTLGVVLFVVQGNISLVIDAARQFDAIFAQAPALALLIILGVPLMLLQLAVLVCGFAALRPFRILAIVTLVLAIIMDLGLAIELGRQGGQGFTWVQIVRLILTVATLIYCIVSRRVRITYLWQVPAGDSPRR